MSTGKNTETNASELVEGIAIFCESISGTRTYATLKVIKSNANHCTCLSIFPNQQFATEY